MQTPSSNEPILVYTWPAKGPGGTSPNNTIPGGTIDWPGSSGNAPDSKPQTSVDAPTVTPDVDLGGLLSRDPNRSVGDAPLYGAGGKNGWPIYGPLPSLGRPAVPMNAMERALAGNFFVALYGPTVFNQYADFVTKGPPGPERTWFELNGATWPVIKINGPLKYQAAEALSRDIEAAASALGPKRMLTDQQIAYLKKLEADLRSDLTWQTGDVAKLRNIVGNLINGLSSAALSILNNLRNMALGGPLSPHQQGQQLVFSALYASIDRLFREGQAFDADAWRKAIQQSLAEAAADDVATSGQPLRTLLLEFYKLTNRLIDIERGEVERQALRKEIERQLDAIRKEIERYQGQFKEPQLMEAVQLELSRQPSYVLAVIADYERLTKIRVRPLVCVTPTIGTQKVCTGLFPFGVLLAVRSRESQVRRDEGRNKDLGFKPHS